MKPYRLILEDSLYLKAIEEARAFLKKKFPHLQIVHDDRDFKTTKKYDMPKYIIHTYEAETASGKDAIAFDIEWK
jgi:hypothetical protein